MGVYYKNEYVPYPGPKSDESDKSDKKEAAVMDIKVTLFKETGKYYTEDTVSIPANLDQVYQVVDWLRENYKSYRDMHLVAMLGEMPNGYPVMLPIGRR